MSGKTFTVRRGQTAIPNQTIYAKYEALTRDGEARSLSIQALGLLLLILSRPTGKASQGYRAFQGRGMGRDALLKALGELDAVGHRYQFKRRGDSGHVVTDTVVSEVPISQEEAEAAWLSGLGPQAREVEPDPGPEAAQEDPGETVDNSQSHRAPEIGATGPDKGSTVRRVTVARLTDASLSRESAKSSLTTFSEDGYSKREGNPVEPSRHGETVDDDATAEDSPNRRMVREMLNKSKAAKLRAAEELENLKRSKEVAPLRIDEEQEPHGDTPGLLAGTQLRELQDVMA